LGEYRQAEQLHRQTLEDCTRVLGPDHPHTLASRGNLAVTLRAQGEHWQAEQPQRQTLEDRTRILGPDHPHTLTSRDSLEEVLADARSPRRRLRYRTLRLRGRNSTT
jgi:hypothetical protein